MAKHRFHFPVSSRLTTTISRRQHESARQRKTRPRSIPARHPGAADRRAGRRQAQGRVLRHLRGRGEGLRLGPVGGQRPHLRAARGHGPRGRRRRPRGRPRRAPLPARRPRHRGLHDPLRRVSRPAAPATPTCARSARSTASGAAPIAEYAVVPERIAAPSCRTACSMEEAALLENLGVAAHGVDCVPHDPGRRGRRPRLRPYRHPRRADAGGLGRAHGHHRPRRAAAGEGARSAAARPWSTSASRTRSQS